MRAVDLAFDRAARCLTVTFDDGAVADLPFELLRVESPSAEVQGHGKGHKKIITGKETVSVVDAEPVGAYAVRIVFDDGHQSGLFTWPYLRQLGDNPAERLAAYKAESLVKDQA
jgi:DUF971 family protein